MTKKELIEKCRKILYSDFISDSDHDFLLSILELHPNYEEKIGLGVKRIFVINNIYGGKCFMLERFDGSATDFSFMKCINNPSKEQLIKRACRDSVNHIILDFKKNQGTHVHHQNISFNDIVFGVVGKRRRFGFESKWFDR